MIFESGFVLAISVGLLLMGFFLIFSWISLDDMDETFFVQLALVSTFVVVLGVFGLVLEYEMERGSLEEDKSFCEILSNEGVEVVEHLGNCYFIHEGFFIPVSSFEELNEISRLRGVQ